MNFSNVPLDITNELFNSLLLPILLYGSEIWGIYDKDDFSSWEKGTIEKTHIFLCKQSLGANKQFPNVAARNELTLVVSIFKFWIHLQNLPDNNIAKQCLQISKDMTDVNQLGIVQKINVLCRLQNSPYFSVCPTLAP